MDSVTSGYSERLSVPLRWWAQGVMLVATFWLAFVVAMPAVAAWLATAVLLAALVALLLSYGAVRIEVAHGELRVGRAHIGLEHVGAADPLDPEAARRVAGVEADARAYLMLRPYLKRAVRVQITDPDDPAPYWLVGTRHPDELAAALRATAGLA